MSKYLIISEHTAEDCRMAVEQFWNYHAGFLTRFEWGCYDDDHHAYAILEADSHEQALMSVPPLFREKARAIRVRHLRPEKASGDSLHEKK